MFDISFWYCSRCCLIFPTETVLRDVWYFLLILFYVLFAIPYWDCSARCLLFPSDTVLGAVWYSLLRLFYEVFHISFETVLRFFVFRFETVLGDVCYLLLFYALFDISFWDSSTRCLTFPSVTVLRERYLIFPSETVLRDTWYFLLRQFYELFDIPFKFCLRAVSYSVLWLFYEMWPL